MIRHSWKWNSRLSSHKMIILSSTEPPENMANFVHNWDLFFNDVKEWDAQFVPLADSKATTLLLEFLAFFTDDRATLSYVLANRTVGYDPVKGGVSFRIDNTLLGDFPHSGENLAKVKDLEGFLNDVVGVRFYD